ncbi:MAG: response regulator [Acidimicrobiia bacterium]|nr:MAG: response regulator [Acidimicrobiia bacterium]
MTDILVVADEPWVVTDVAAALGDGRFRIAAQADPRSAAATVEDTSPDAVLVDMQVGSMGGMAVTRAIRDAFAGKDQQPPPVILLLDRDADAFLAGRSGAEGWIRKPFGAADLRHAIDQVLR